MFILRIVFNSGVTHNQVLGNHYQIIRPENEKDFNHLLKKACHKDETIGFILHGANESESWPIYENHKYYIMTESGKTFERVLLS